MSTSFSPWTDLSRLIGSARQRVIREEYEIAVKLIEQILTERQSDHDLPNAVPQIIELLQKCRSAPDVDIVIARAQYCGGEIEESIKKLVKVFYSKPHDWFLKYHERYTSLLKTVAAEADPDLLSIVQGRPFEYVGDRSDILLKRFYLGGMLSGNSLGRNALVTLDQLEESQNRGPSIDANDQYIQFLKTYSSASPRMGPKRPHAVGGGYLLVSNGYGYVIDPGHHFLDNFFNANHSIDDVDVIVVTHFHDDHYADLPALLSLLHKRWRNSKRKRGKIAFLCDRITWEKFHCIVESASDYLEYFAVFDLEQVVSLSPGVRLQLLPTHHNVFGENDSGMGLIIDIETRKTTVIITGDTAWTSEIEASYLEIKTNYRHKRVLVPHVSSVTKVEIPFLRGRRAFHTNHLCIAGLCKAIETVEPQVVLLSEIGEELDSKITCSTGSVLESSGKPDSTVNSLVRLLKDVYSLDECAWYATGRKYSFYDTVVNPS